MSETELKPCRCGGHIYVGEYKFDDGTMWRIGCMRCGLLMDTVRTRPEAIAAWNRGPLPSEARRLAIEEAAKVADGLAAELSRLKGSGDRRVQIGSLLETCATIAQGIRALIDRKE